MLCCAVLLGCWPLLTSLVMDSGTHNATALLLHLQVVKDLKKVVLPFPVLPLSDASKPAVLPQPNKFAPVCEPGTFRGPDDFLPCIKCKPGEFQEFSGKTNCELCPKVRLWVEGQKGTGL